MKSIQTILKTFKKFLLGLWYKRGRIPLLNLPIPWRFPYGCWFMIYPDEMGLNLFPWRRRSYSYEEGECRFCSKFFKRGMVCFDIGANQGFYTIFMSRYVGAQGLVFTFEPVLTEIKKLKMNIRINHCSNVILEKMAVGCQEGITDIIVCLDGHGSRSGLSTPPEEVKARIKIDQVPITTLDFYVQNNNIKHIDFIKIDVEGGERDVLKGGIEVLTTLRPLIMVEMADVATQQFGYRAVENYRILEAYGYRLFKVTRRGFLKFTKPKDSYRENLIAVPKEKLQQVSDFIEVL